MKKLLIFKSQTCAPCKALNNSMKEVQLDVDSIMTVDTSCDRELFMEYNVRSVPTSIILVDGKEVSRYIGFTDIASYIGFVNTEDYVE